jgi:hypothetical protein
MAGPTRRGGSPARVGAVDAATRRAHTKKNTPKNPRKKNQHHSQGALEPFNLVEGPSAWKAADFKSPDDYTTRLTPADLEELDAAVKVAAAAAWPAEGDGAAKNAANDEKTNSNNTSSLLHKIYTSPDQARQLLPTLAPKLEKMRDDAIEGRGFALLSGFPVERYSRRETLAGYWLFGLLWGKAASNNKKGHMIGHIKDIGHDPSHPDTRLYATAAAQPWHNDAADLVSLLCLHNAKEGGLSSWSSSISVYNAVLKSHPHLARVLAGPWFMDRKGEVPPGKKPFFEIPVFNFFRGFLSVNISENYFLLSQRHAEVPRLTPDHYEALRVFNAYAASDEFKISAMLQPGEIQLLSNHTCLHHRGAFVDFLEEHKRRHLLRLWLAPDNAPPLPEVYEEIYGGNGLEVGSRGGIHVADTVECVPEEAE